MAYPNFGGGRPLWFVPFDPSHLAQATDVLANVALASAGPRPLYNTNAFDPPTGGTPAGWNPRFAMYGNAGMWQRTSPILWAQRFGMNRAMLLTYAGGETPS